MSCFTKAIQNGKCSARIEFDRLTPEPTLRSQPCLGQPRLGLERMSPLLAGAGQPLWWVWPLKDHLANFACSDFSLNCFWIAFPRTGVGRGGRPGSANTTAVFFISKLINGLPGSHTYPFLSSRLRPACPRAEAHGMPTSLRFCACEGSPRHSLCAKEIPLGLLSPTWPAFSGDSLALQIKLPGQTARVACRKKAETVPGSNVCSKFHILPADSGCWNKGWPLAADW